MKIFQILLIVLLASSNVYFIFNVNNLENKYSELNSTFLNLSNKCESAQLICDSKTIKYEKRIKTNEKTLINMSDKLNIKDDRISILQSINDKLKEEIESSNLKFELSNNMYVPTKQQLKKILNKYENNRKYDLEEYNCVEFSSELVKNLKTENIFSCTTHIDYEEDGHMIVAINTTSGIVYVEPQINKIMRNVDELIRVYGDTEINKISSCYNVEDLMEN